MPYRLAIAHQQTPIKGRWIKGFEPLASRATIWRANQLRYTHHRSYHRQYAIVKYETSLKGFEPPTHGLEGRCSIQLSYRLIFTLRFGQTFGNLTFSVFGCSANLAYLAAFLTAKVV